MLKVLVCVLLLAVAGCTAPIHNVGHAPMHDVRYMSAATSTILIAGEKRGWDMRVIEPGQIKGALNVRNTHFANVDIMYTPQDYSILYADSKNLRYSESSGQIHKSYNLWVEELAQEIFYTSELMAVLAGWVERPMDELMTRWGPPDKQSVLTDGGSVIEYRHDTTTGAGLYGWCQVSFTVTQARIVSDFRARGNDCGRYVIPAPS